MEWTWAHIDWEKTLAAGVGVATLVQAAVALIMMRGLRYARDQAGSAAEGVAENRRSSEQQLRAYVENKIVTVLPLAMGSDIVVQAVIKNYGQTPAREAIGYIAASIVPAGRFDLAPLPDTTWPGTRSNLAPGDDINIVVRLAAAQFGTGIADVLAGTHQLVATGVVEYDDIFRKRWRTEFVRILESPTDAVMAHAPSGNKST